MVTALMYFEFHGKVFNKCKLADGEDLGQYIRKIAITYENQNKMQLLSMALPFITVILVEHSVYQAQCKHFPYVI